MSERRRALVALLRAVGLEAPGAAELVEAADPLSAPDCRAALTDALAAAASAVRPAQEELFTAAATESTTDDPGLGRSLDERLAAAAADLDELARSGLELLSVVDEGYPANLRAVADRPPAILVAGALAPDDRRAVAVVGTRHPSDDGAMLAARLSVELAQARVTVVSGLAAGIDTIAHRATLDAGGRTIAVIGTGHGHAYPPANAELQRRLAVEQAVVSPFWPQTPPSADGFRRRNGVMSGLARGTVIVEASVRSGTRVQARLALAHGRPVFLAHALLAQGWARELARRPGVHVVDAAADVLAVLSALDDPRPPEP